MIKLKQIVAYILAAGSLLGSAQAFNFSGFAGAYDPANWTLSNTSANGFVDTTALPGVPVIALVGGDGGFDEVGPPGMTRWNLNGGLPESGNLEFYWGYLSDDIPGFDEAGFHYNGTDFSLGLVDGDHGYFMLPGALAGESFGFYVSTTDNVGGPGVLFVSDEDFFSTPDGGSTLFLLGGGLVVLTGLHRRLRMQG